MPKELEFDRDANLADIVEKIRAERFPNVPRDLMLTFLKLHAAADRPENLRRQIDEALASTVREQA